MGMAERQYSALSGYRYGFNGKENDNEIKGEGNQQDYGMRIYDPRLGKFLSSDPIAKDYPGVTPYAFAENDVIRSIDLDGLEKFIVISFLPGRPTIICFGCGMMEAYNNYSGGMAQKSMVENKEMSYHNDNVPQSIQNRLDKQNALEADLKIANGLAQTTTISIQSSFELATMITPAGKGVAQLARAALQLSRFRLAEKFYKSVGFLDDVERTSHLKGINFTEAVEKITLKKGTVVEQWVKEGGEVGSYFASEGADAAKLGIKTEGRVLKKFTLQENVEVLKSTTNDIKKGEVIKHTGGETQYFNPELKNKVKEIKQDVQQKKIN
jgi:RHS repeat-associated protein